MDGHLYYIWRSKPSKKLCIYIKNKMSGRRTESSVEGGEVPQEEKALGVAREDLPPSTYEYRLQQICPSNATPLVTTKCQYAYAAPVTGGLDKANSLCRSFQCNGNFVTGKQTCDFHDKLQSYLYKPVTDDTNDILDIEDGEFMTIDKWRKIRIKIQEDDIQRVKDVLDKIMDELEAMGDISSSSSSSTSSNNMEEFKTSVHQQISAILEDPESVTYVNNKLQKVLTDVQKEVFTRSAKRKADSDDTALKNKVIKSEVRSSKRLADVNAYANRKESK